MSDDYSENGNATKYVEKIDSTIRVRRLQVVGHISWFYVYPTTSVV